MIGIQSSAVRTAALQTGTFSLQLFRTTFKAMGGSNEIVAAADRKEDAAPAMQQAAGEVLRIERKYSRYRDDPDSIVYRINRGAGEAPAVACDPETVDLIEIADKLYKSSDGLFDITSGILRRGWDFSKPALPSRDDLAPLLDLVGWNKVERGKDTIRLPSKGMEIDFGGFGKEYATDRAAALLVRADIKHGYVSLGGDIRAIGGQPDGNPWKFGVKDPRDHNAVIANIQVTNGGVATSGDYVKFFELDGERYCHILNPRTGFPVKCWRSVSVSSVSALAAGAMSTIAMLKESDAVPFLSKSDCGYLLVDSAGQVITNSQSTNLERS